MKNTKVLVLAGGFDQIKLIQELQKRDKFVILADYFENPPAKKYANKFYQVSTLDEEAIFKIAKNEEVEIVTTACTDQALLTVARVSERLELPCYISSEKALKVTNKYYMKSVFQTNNITSAKYCLFENIDDLYKTVNMINSFPYIVKPCDCNSSKGVVKVENFNELLVAVETAFSLSRSKKVIVEEYIDGIEISIDVWLDDYGAKVLSITETSKIEGNENFTIYQSKYPIRNYSDIENKSGIIASRIAEAFDLSNCPLLIQAILSNDNIYVVEFSARIGGGTKYRLIEEISGIDIMSKYVDRVLGDVEQVFVPNLSEKYIELDYIYANNGIISAIKGLENEKDNFYLDDYFVYKNIKDVIEKRTTSSDRVFGFLVSDKDKSGLINKRKHVLTHTDILDDNGLSMMCVDYFDK